MPDHEEDVKIFFRPKSAVPSSGKTESSDDTSAQEPTQPFQNKTESELPTSSAQEPTQPFPNEVKQEPPHEDKSAEQPPSSSSSFRLKPKLRINKDAEIGGHAESKPTPELIPIRQTGTKEENQPHLQRPKNEDKAKEDAIEAEALMKLKMYETKNKFQLPKIPIGKMILPFFLIGIFVFLYLVSRTLESTTGMIGGLKDLNGGAVQGKDGKKKTALQKKIEGMIPKNPMLDELLQDDPEARRRTEAAAPAQPPPEPAVQPVVEPEKAPPAAKLTGDAVYDEFKAFFDRSPSEFDLKLRISDLQRNYPEDLSLHRKIIELLSSSGRTDFVIKKYVEWSGENADSYAANMIAASFQKDPEKAIPYYKRACSLSDSSTEAFYALSAIYEYERDWRKVIETLYSALIIFPGDDALRVKLADIKIRSGISQESAYSELKKHYIECGFKGPALALKLLPGAQLYSLPDLSADLLYQISGDPQMRDDYRYYALRHALIYCEEAPADALSPYTSPRTRQMQKLYYISRKEFTKALRVPTAEFPDFWNAFISWYQNDPSWKINAARLARKNGKQMSDSLIPTIVSIWQLDDRAKEIKTREAKEMLRSILPENEALFYFLLAETAVKSDNMIGANVFYIKARARSGIYATMIKTYNNR